MKKLLICIFLLLKFENILAANYTLFFNNTITVEGRTFVNMRFDRGRETMFGITIGTYTRFCALPKVPIVCDKNNDNHVDYKDLALMRIGEAKPIYKKYYWDVSRGDSIKNQAIAEFITDFFVNSGASKGNIKRIQKIVGVKQDGVFGSLTIKSINRQNPKLLFEKLYKFRLQFFKKICMRDKRQLVFWNGWNSRLSKLKIIYKNGKFI